MSDSVRTPRPFLAFSLLVFGIAAIMMIATLPRQSLTLTTGLVLLVIAAFVSENYALAVKGYNISLGFPLTMSAVLLHGPLAAVLVAVASGVKIDDVKNGTRPVVVMYNVSQLAVISIAAGWAYVVTGGRTLVTTAASPLVAADFPRVLLPLFLAAAVCALGNVFLASIGLGLYTRQTPRAVFNSIAWSVPSLIAMAFVGYLLAQVLAINVWAFPLFVFPLIVARQMYQGYAELSGAYADTVRSLVGALEAKDPYTRGHSERVATYAVQVGHELKLDRSLIEKLEYAALLHDLGKLSLPTCVLSKADALTDEEFAQVRRHPIQGAEMVERIPPLRGLAVFVRGHHERFDGGGYPDGAAGTDIELLSRVLSVADAFDAMTTTRAYRDALDVATAERELVREAGKQFDPDVVTAFVTARATLPVDRAPAPQGESVSSTVEVEGAC
jgi:HD-GYP domain-containing protein (c-di-GMP phosphodiesterase class II)